MKRFSALFVFFVFTFLFLTVAPASAKVISNQNGSVTVARGEVVNDDLFAGAQTVTVSGTVNGDVFAGAETVNVDGTVNGNLHVGASTVNLSGKVKGNVYIGAGMVNVNKSVVGGSLIIGSGNVNIDKDTVVTGSVIAGAGNVYIDSTVRRNVIIGAGNATIGPDTKIAKDLYYGVGNEQGDIVIPATAVISGSIHKSVAQLNPPDMEATRKEIGSAIRSAKVFALVGGFISALLVGYLYIRFFGKKALGAADLICNNFWKSMGIGAIVSILAFPVLVILLLTLVGVPLAGLLFLVFIIYLYMAKIVVGLAIGQWMSAKFKWTKLPVFASFAIGLLIVYLLKVIPVVNVFTGVVVLWSGLGALTLTTTPKSE